MFGAIVAPGTASAGVRGRDVLVGSRAGLVGLGATWEDEEVAVEAERRH